MRTPWFLPTIILYIITGTYLLYIAYTNPYLGLEVEEVNGEWILTEDYSPYLFEGDVVISIDNIAPSNILRLQYESLIRGASEIVIRKTDNETLKVKFNQSFNSHNFYTLFLFPLIYFLLILTALFYFKKRERNIQQLKILILFIISMSLAYISMGASGSADLAGLIINSGCLILSVVLLISFLKSYFKFLNIKWLFIENIKCIYIIPLLVAILRLIQGFYPFFSSFNNILILTIFKLLISYNLYILIRGYITYRLSKLKLLFMGLILPFFPFLVLYVLPSLFFESAFIDADICALFLLLIPFNITFLQLSERLFDIVYHITRFRYYFLLSLFFTCLSITGIYLIGNLSLVNLSFISIFMFLLSLLALYFKEYTDYQNRKVLFSPKGDNIHKLYNVIEKIGLSHRIEQMLLILEAEVQCHLDVKDVAVITYNFEDKSTISSNPKIHLPNLVSISNLQLGKILKNNESYVTLIHQDNKLKRWLIIDHHQTIRLKAEELLWLELLLIYTNSFIENTKIIEQLLEELNQLKQNDVNEPTWLRKLVWIRVENEKLQLAQELHDTVLQDYLHIARQLEGFIDEEISKSLKSNLRNTHKQMLLSINNLRNYCESLNPPLLTTAGLNAALERLFELTTMRADFKLITRIKRLYLEDEQLNLVIYRVIQELLNNAIKHSQADKVELYLQDLESGFDLIYRDNGIGCNISEIGYSTSMGLQGIRSRIEAFDGQVIIDSDINKGLFIQIKIIERSEQLDFSINSR